MGITIYTKTNCFPCKRTKEKFTTAHIEYVERSIEQLTEAELEEVKKIGTSAPIVVTPDDQWAGLRPDKIKKTVETYGAAV